MRVNGGFGMNFSRKENEMKEKLFLALILGIALASVGCTSGRTMVMNVPAERIKSASMNIVEEQPTVSVPSEVKSMFRDKLETALFGGEPGTSPSFTKGLDLKVSYRFIQFTAGSQFQRWLAGGMGGYGEGVMTVEARFTNAAGKEISKIQSEGKVGAGFFGGAIDGAIEKCVEEVAQYAKQNFR
jgi:hypothetical protein